MAQTVRVRYNGEVVPISALTIDDSLCGGEEIYRQIALELDLPPARMKIVHKGKLLTQANINMTLREEPRAIVQVLGSKAAVIHRPLSARISDTWYACILFFLNLLPRTLRENGGAWWARFKDNLVSFFYGTLEFLRTFMPGHVPAPLPQRQRRMDGGEEGEQQPNVRVQRRIDTNSRHCRDEINMEMIDRFNPGGGGGGGGR